MTVSVLLMKVMMLIKVSKFSFISTEEESLNLRECCMLCGVNKDLFMLCVGFSEIFSFQWKVAQSFYGNASVLPGDAEGGCVSWRHSSQYTIGSSTNCSLFINTSFQLKSSDMKLESLFSFVF